MVVVMAAGLAKDNPGGREDPRESSDISGVMQGLMWRAVNEDGTLTYSFVESLEAMYPFYFGPAVGTRTLAADDVAIASTMYPEPGFFAGTGSISGTITDRSGNPLGIEIVRRLMDTIEYERVDERHNQLTLRRRLGL